MFDQIAGKKLIGYHGTTYEAAMRIICFGPSTTACKKGVSNTKNFYVARHLELSEHFAYFAAISGVNFDRDDFQGAFMRQKNQMEIKRNKTANPNSGAILAVYGSPGINYFWDVMDDDVEDYICHKNFFNKSLPLATKYEQMIIPKALWYSLGFSLLEDWDSDVIPKWYSNEAPF